MLTNAFIIAALALSAIIIIESTISVILITKIAMRNKVSGKKTSNGTKLNTVALFLLAAFPAGLLVACIVLFIEAALLLYTIICCLKKVGEPVSDETAQIKDEPAVVSETKPEPEPEPEPQPLPEIEIHESITVEEAHDAIDDSVAATLVEIHHVEADSAEVETSNEPRTFSKKEIINIDTLSSNFNSGDIVNLDTLKEKELIPKKTDYIKVLARGTLDKHLTVEANEFSADAIKMIVLTGGKAIKDE